MYWLKDYEFCYMGRDMVNICLGILRTYNLVVIDLIKSDAHSLRKYKNFSILYNDYQKYYYKRTSKVNIMVISYS